MLQRLFKYVRLQGRYTLVNEVPQKCAYCGTSSLYEQSDFRRDFGLWVVGLAALLCSLFAFYHFNWFVTWSPMFVALLIDRSFALGSPHTIICYSCGHLHRGLSKKECQSSVKPFDLELHDRLHYQN